MHANCYPHCAEDSALLSENAVIFRGRISCSISNIHPRDFPQGAQYKIDIPMNTYLSTILLQSPIVLSTNNENQIHTPSYVGGTQTDAYPRPPTTEIPNKTSSTYPVDDCAAAGDGVEKRPPAPAPNGDDAMAAPLDCVGVPNNDIAHHLPCRITLPSPRPMNPEPTTLHRGLELSVGCHSSGMAPRRT